MFGQGSKPGALKVVKSTVTPSGVVCATYARDSAVRTGTFA